MNVLDKKDERSVTDRFHGKTWPEVCSDFEIEMAEWRRMENMRPTDYWGDRRRKDSTP